MQHVGIDRRSGRAHRDPRHRAGEHVLDEGVAVVVGVARDQVAGSAVELDVAAVAGDDGGRLQGGATAGVAERAGGYAHRLDARRLEILVAGIVEDVGVVAGAALEPVGALAAVERVVAVAALQVVGAVHAREQVAAAVALHEVGKRVAGAGDVAAAHLQQVLHRGKRHQRHAEVGLDGVAGAAAVDDLVDRRVVDDVGVVAEAAVERVGAAARAAVELVVGLVALDLVALLVAGDVDAVSAGHGGGALDADAGVQVDRALDLGVVGGAAADLDDGVAAVDDVGVAAGAAVEPVVAAAALERVVAVAAGQLGSVS